MDFCLKLRKVSYSKFRAKALFVLSRYAVMVCVKSGRPGST
jgi:hypothetical protein